MSETPQIIVCLTTVADERQAHSLARLLLADKVAACVQIDSPIQSFYRWDDKDCVEQELRLVIKTTAEQTEKLKSTLMEHHPYSQPQILMLGCIDAESGYANWVAESVG
ncbi:divalent-cation tolerance protein CutA [Stieleria sp. JC731]|uniref:divalent-cation tolerance protein CutA n=1 Tax=Pirellulaceae TaxID=2691357 RepID=UPI001E285799|nr:divalent-cation tolerance protein CutA [Stieleria sp. JC731]MCC9603933.1 divalent-cation tolerance protein CutA [Stieleria sp. JC731]